SNETSSAVRSTCYELQLPAQISGPCDANGAPASGRGGGKSRLGAWQSLPPASGIGRRSGRLNPCPQIISPLAQIEAQEKYQSRVRKVVLKGSHKAKQQLTWRSELRGR